MSSFQIEDLKYVVKMFSSSQCDVFSEYCITALENQNHSSGCMLKVVGRRKKDIELKWNKTFSKAGYQEEKKIIEKAAEAISFFLSSEFTQYTIIREARMARRGFSEGGFDYWLGHHPDDSKYDPKHPFLARIEISGINAENPANTLERRMGVKVQQMSKSDSRTLPGYVSIVVFFPLKAYFGQK